MLRGDGVGGRWLGQPRSEELSHAPGLVFLPCLLAPTSDMHFRIHETEQNRKWCF